MSEAIELQDIFSQAQRHAEHVFLMPTKIVAAGYGVGESSIRNHKREKTEELTQGKHWIKDEQGNTLWTARGVIQLGFCTQSPQGTKFRAWAESQVVGTVSQTDALQTLDATAKAIAGVIVEQLSAEQILQERINHHVQRGIDAQIPAVGAESLGKSLAAQWGLSNLAGLTEAIAQQLQPEAV